MNPTPSRTRRHLVLGLASSTLGAAALSSARAADAPWPTRPVKLLVPYAAGGSTDIFGRLLGAKLTQQLGQQVIVENKGGGAGTVGASAFCKSAPDDHSFMAVTPSQLSINQWLYKTKLGYDPVADLAPVSLATETTNAIVVPMSLPVKSFKDFIDYCKAHPGKVSYSSAGIGSTGHLLNELLKTTVGIDIVHIPYRGNGPAMQALLTGEVQMNTDNMPQLIAQIKSEKVRALAVTSKTRWFQLPEMPTVAELGYPALTTMVWFGVVAQASMHKPIIARMNREMGIALNDADFKARLRENGLQANPSTPEQMLALAAAERMRWKKVVEVSGATAE
jgi:tripartite-type tricarboxylate transporter receptor subunit TctC